MSKQMVSMIGNHFWLNPISPKGKCINQTEKSKAFHFGKNNLLLLLLLF